MNIELSIVIIGKNEEQNIGRCLESIESAMKNTTYNYEVIFVDSNSKDNTIKIASEFEFKNFSIYKIINSNFYTASLARNIGCEKSCGKYILFLDADMVLHSGFIEIAIPKLFVKKHIGGIIGIRNDIVKNGNGNNVINKNVYKTNVEKKATHFGGALLAKSSVIKKVGGYSGHLIASEEPELYIRLLSNGYFVKEINVDMIDHYDRKSNNKIKIKALFSKRSSGIGQVIKESLINRNFDVLLHHKPIMQFLVPWLCDVISVFTLLISMFSLSGFFLGVTFLVQLISLFICIFAYNPKKFLISKIMFYSITKGLFIGRNVEFNLLKVK
ncbi:glycosyltransferase family A protein [Bacillus sp. N1-1]|uniref:glycosyltransferase family 2 protein n=1 Tax=Bacillus sp. N1-1 TaxID=2682541 RepID=UPI00135C5728|nr:glycosyltransferase family A protein [Bacillus sp. N1-1]